MTLPERVMLLNLERDELEARLRAVSEKTYIKWAEQRIARWKTSGAQANLVLHSRGAGYAESEQIVTVALQQDVDELTKLLATMEAQR